MAAPSPVIRERIHRALVKNDLSGLSSVIRSTIQQTRKRARKDRIHEVNSAVIDSALEYERPELIALLQNIHDENLPSLLSTLLAQYTQTRNEAWLSAMTGIIAKLDKKGDQSEMQAHLCRVLVETGSSRSDRMFITKAMEILDEISFRKYRSGVLTGISPSLIDWAVSQGDLTFLHSLYTLTDSISDISKKSVIHARIASAVAAIAVARTDLATWMESIRIASGIRQKSRRQSCIRTIVLAAVPTSLFDRIRNITVLAAILPDVPEEVLHEVIASVLLQELITEKDYEVIRSIVMNVARDLPAAEPTVISVLLQQAGETGNPYFFSLAITLQGDRNGNGEYPVNEFVKAALAVFRTTGGTGTLHQVIPSVIASSSPSTASRILLHIVQTLLAKGELSEAVAVFLQTKSSGERDHLYAECSTALIKHAIMADRTGETAGSLRIQKGSREWGGAISRSVTDICRQHAFSEISTHAEALAAMIALHPQHDQLVLENITFLIHRGFLETADPDVLIRLTRSVVDPGIRERALSTIVIRVAKIGGETHSRDFLQRAVGLSCLIEDVRTRSLTMTAVIDEATVLAVADGDLGLLRRMHEWSSSLLSLEAGVTASANIIEGMITYAGDRRYPAALDEAYKLALALSDPSLKADLTDRISENYVRIGCLLIQDYPDQPEHGDFADIFRLFVCGLDILAGSDRPGDLSLKIAHRIDIIFESQKERFRAELVPALMLFTLEIRQTIERDAMAARIASQIRTLAGHPDTTDPYESIVQVLLQSRYLPKDLVLLALVRRTAEQIKDAFVRSLQLSYIAGLYIEISGSDEAAGLLETITRSAQDIDGEYRQVILLSECAGRYVKIAEEPAQKTLLSAFTIFKTLEYDPDATAARLLIATIARISSVYPDTGLITMAQETAARITNPPDYAAALLPVYRMAPGKTGIRSGIKDAVRRTAGEITVPIQKAPLLLDLADEMIRAGDTQDISAVLLQARKTVDLVQIPFLADIFRRRIAGIYVQLFQETGEDRYLAGASAIIPEIGNEEIRLSAAGFHQKISAVVPHHYLEMREIAERMVTERHSTAHVLGLENMVRLVQDRGIAARYFCMIAIIFNSTGKTRLARHFYDTALEEARVIRPLSRRAYVLCDLALVLDAAGCRIKAQEMMDHAIDAATGIRQFSDRDEVFDGLAAVMRWMRE
jgi:hypothetical protein